MKGEVILSLATPAPEIVEGRTYQVHLLPGNKVQLIPVVLLVELQHQRCPVMIGHERCGLTAGHAGPHRWAGGD